MIGFLSLSSSFSRFFEFFFLFCMKKSSQKRALERDLGKDKRRGEIVFLALFCVEKTEGKNIFANEKISRWKKETKRRQKASKEEENILSLSLFLGRQGFLSPPIVVINISSSRREK